MALPPLVNRAHLHETVRNKIDWTTVAWVTFAWRRAHRKRCVLLLSMHDDVEEASLSRFFFSFFTLFQPSSNPQSSSCSLLSFPVKIRLLSPRHICITRRIIRLIEASQSYPLLISAFALFSITNSYFTTGLAFPRRHPCSCIHKTRQRTILLFLSPLPSDLHETRLNPRRTKRKR